MSSEQIPFSAGLISWHQRPLPARKQLAPKLKEGDEDDDDDDGGGGGLGIDTDGNIIVSHANANMIMLMKMIQVITFEG